MKIGELAGGIECVCPINTYLLKDGSACDPCPIGANCQLDGGITWETLATRSGYWRNNSRDLSVPSEAANAFVRCQFENQCPGEESGEICNEFHTGVLCSQCIDDYHIQAGSTCVKCEESSLWFFILVIIIAVAAVVLLFYIVLRRGRDLMTQARREDEAELAAIESDDEYEDADLYRDRSILDDQDFDPRKVIAGPTPTPNFTYKLKIGLGFAQIVSNVTLGVDLAWPSSYKSFMSYLNFANLDFLQVSSITCVFPDYDYYWKYIFFVGVPLGVFFLASLYLVPKFVLHWRWFSDEDEFARKRDRRRFWRMFLFTLFLLYPSVTAVVIRLWNCRDIGGVRYLASDLSVECSGSKYDTYSAINVLMLLVYPIGIPAFIFTMLFRYRKRLREPGVRGQLGFLYDAYFGRYWWFELIDMLHKALMVSVPPFMPSDVQLPFAMGILGSYTIVLLVMKPYLRKGDDRLHLLAQTELILLVLFAHSFSEELELSPELDTLLSAVLIVLTLAFVSFFIVQVSTVARKRHRRSKEEQRRQKELDDAGDDGIATGGHVGLGSNVPGRLAQAAGFRDAVLEDNPLYKPKQIEAVRGTDQVASDIQLSDNPLFNKKDGDAKDSGPPELASDQMEKPEMGPRPPPTLVSSSAAPSLPSTTSFGARKLKKR
eukprot:GABV01000077.1.p1 GENE.GABV01000077.1~~GABV01000077.1.p1  ORF type:complete len:659 (+),score=179.96 GABV01000077.1:106-2082(+)